ncbi:hypothetical protein HZS_4627, partial [Henneguya salminicola]
MYFIEMKKNFKLFVLIFLLIFVSKEYNFDQTYNIWPNGSYGLPEPKSGCPKEGTWKTGFIYQNTEDDMNSNSHSKSYEGKGRFTDQGIELRFCMKQSTKDESKKWPNGSYCLYKYGNINIFDVIENCPEIFIEGHVFWQDEKNIAQIPNHHGGVIPDGVYNLTSTLIKFCCINTTEPTQPIELPTEYPFYLFPFEKECQKVRNTEVKVAEEWIHFDDDDEGNTDYTKGSVPYGINPQEDYNIILKLCYYTEKDDPLLKELKMKQEPLNTSLINKRSIILGISATTGCLLIAVAAIITYI